MADLKLNRRVRIERPSTAKDELDQPTGGFEAVATVWASLKLASGLQAILASEQDGTVKASIRTRYRTDAQNGWRIVLLKFVDGQAVDEEVFSVDADMPDYEGREFTDFVCTRERGTNG
ncbi:phage head closure protein [Paraburkholderia sp. J8-2]|uniref:phage head closure protein n=1 Tax=Paraburkholderia sp. J8-2 TaxID=2805440 RepID=UPI002AB754EE|nr:phage head closure protein [Paraburkholderia sp. J8-2]